METQSDIGTKMVRTLDRVRLSTGVSLAFGGRVGRAGEVHLEHFSGRTHGALAGVTLEPNEGLGGKSVGLRRPIAVDNYVQTRSITHKYDRIIQAERLQALVAMPVIVGRIPVAIIYGAFRTIGSGGERILDAMASEARVLEQELVVNSTVSGMPGSDLKTQNAQLREHLRYTYAKLRMLAGTMPSATDRDAVFQLASELEGYGNAVRGTPLCGAVLTRRETDVLALAAVGMSNNQIAALLGLTLHTVKGYLRAAMRKLGAATRLEAVTFARRANLLA